MAALERTPPPSWPHAARSRQLQAAGLQWHVQTWPQPRPDAPWLLLLHGTGASAHSFAGLAPLLAPHFGLIVPDLPGHAWTQRPRSPGLSLPGMAGLVGGLLRELSLSPLAIVGHSAGAAVAARLVLDGLARPQALVSLNGAWFPPRGVSDWWYAPAARLLALNPVAPWLFAWQASRPAVLNRLLQGTGSRIDAAGQDCYARLAASVDHVGTVLAMMAAWDLVPLPSAMPRLVQQGCALHLVAGECDAAVPAQQADELARRVPGAQVHRLVGLGHLAHEEAPQALAALIQRLLSVR